MRSHTIQAFRVACGLMALLAIGLAPLAAEDRFQVEVFGGVSYLNPGDLNLFSRAEEQQNQLTLIETYLGWQGYFINEFPRIRSLVPVGVRLKYRISGKWAVSLEAEGYRRTRETSLSGSFTTSPNWSMTAVKAYAPYRLGLRGFSVMGGLHRSFRAGQSTELEVGVAAGWTRAEFDFRSTWTNTLDFAIGEFTHHSVDGGTLEGTGKGDGFSAKASFRLNRALGRKFGLFLETSATYCRLRSFRGSGRETRLGIPGETSWEGDWGVKKEDVEVFWGSSDSILVPTNYWEGWAAGQRERDFVLDLSGARLSLGLYLKF